MNPVERLLRDEIGLHGPISFARFMAAALYSPDFGYYETHDRTIGRSGDFFTSVSVGSLFGELIARRLVDWIPRLEGGLGPYWIVEAGAHRGEWAGDILTGLQRFAPGLLAECRYTILEPSPKRRAWQKEKLAASWSQHLQWFNGPEELPPFRGVVVSNELLDAFPVHQFQWEKATHRWRERGVAIVEGQFQFTPLDHPTVDPEDALRQAGFEFNDELLEVIPDGFILEAAPGASEWWSTVGTRLNSGWMLTFDYGATSAELLQPQRTEGTLRAYSSHQVSRDILNSPGDQDLTAHVNFTAIERAGEKAGMRTEGLWTQGQFLTTGLAELLRKGERVDWSEAEKRQFQTLVHPGHLGRSFRALLQSKGIVGSPSGIH